MMVDLVRIGIIKMTFEQAQQVAEKMDEMGFSIYVPVHENPFQDNVVIVALRRWLSLNEVETALEQAFGEIEFNLKRIDSQKVRVS